jgi:hypothetical protein
VEAQFSHHLQQLEEEPVETTEMGMGMEVEVEVEAWQQIKLQDPELQGKEMVVDMDLGIWDTLVQVVVVVVVPEEAVVVQEVTTHLVVVVQDLHLALVVQVKPMLQEEWVVMQMEVVQVQVEQRIQETVEMVEMESVEPMDLADLEL